MLRFLIRNFQQNMLLTDGVTATQLQSFFLVGRFVTNTKTGNQDNHYIPRSESAYIVNYDTQDELSRLNSKRFIDHLKFRLRMSKSDIEKFILDESVEKTYKQRNLNQVLDKLISYGVSKKSFLELPWIITLDYSTLDEKFELLNLLQPKDINHVTPFLRLSKKRLEKLVTSLNSENNSIPEGNRIYYISEKLKVDPAMVSKYLFRRLFILEMPFDMFNENLKSMIDYNVSPADLLRDLWAFRYKPVSIKSRFERVKSAKKRKIMPWMVRCTEPILQRSIKLSLDELKILDGKPSIVEYVAGRLKFDVEFTKAIMDKHPAVLKVRATKIKEVLDFLLDEEKFTPHEIAQNPRILCHGLETTKKRIEELKSINCRPSSLVILCRSKREYQKFVDYWMDLEKNVKKQNE